jgi:hypothetical protein
VTPAEWRRRVEAIEEAIRRAVPAQLNIRIVNDPKDGETLAPFHDRSLVRGYW